MRVSWTSQGCSLNCMRTTHSFVFEVVLSPSVGVGACSWNTVSAAKVALLLATASCVDVSLAVIGLHDLLDRDDFVPEADANSAFRALEITIAMLSWLFSSDEASSSPSISITPSDSILRSSSFSASRAIGEVP